MAYFISRDEVFGVTDETTNSKNSRAECVKEWNRIIRERRERLERAKEAKKEREADNG